MVYSYRNHKVATAEQRALSRKGNNRIFWNGENVLIITWMYEIVKILSNTCVLSLQINYIKNTQKYVNPDENGIY